MTQASNITGSSLRPDALGTHYCVAAGHQLAALAAYRILEGGGNAVDAGVAGGICLAVVHPDIVNFAGVAPIMIYSAKARNVVTISGLGTWPRLATLEYFQQACSGEIPEGLPRTLVPAAPDAWITALEQHGTFGFAEVAAPAIELARDGFPISAFVAGMIQRYEQSYHRWPTSAPIYLPDDRPPSAGQRFVLSDLARTLLYMADQDRSKRGAGRQAGLAAARDAFYRGDIAEAIVRHHRENGGLLRHEDLEGFRVGVESSLHVTYNGYDVHTCGFWCQGPVLLQMLNILGPLDLKSLGHNSPAYIHTLTEAMKLAFADREHYYGDPRHVSIPIDGLLSERYGGIRRSLIDKERAWPEMPPRAIQSPVVQRRPLPGWGEPRCQVRHVDNWTPRTSLWSIRRAMPFRLHRVTSPWTPQLFQDSDSPFPRGDPNRGWIRAIQVFSLRGNGLA
jgi:gamma-glutamyltranspeptidase/glutathione hydrolase